MMPDVTEVVLERLGEPDPRRETAYARQRAVWRGEEPDYLPLLCESVGQPWDGRDYTLAEQAIDLDKMLHEALVVVERQLPVKSDSVLSIRPQFGVGTLTTPFGCEYELSAKYGAPWVLTHPPKERLAWLEPEVLDLQLGPHRWACLFTECFSLVLGDRLPVYMADTQGPFDIAHQVRGHDIFTDLYDDPPFVHHLMELTTHVYIEVSRQFKNALDEPDSSGHHSGNLAMEDCGVRLCDDSGVLLPPALLEEFVFPYHQRALAAFGGGWVHFCGRAPQLVDGYLQIPEVKALNFGQPEMYDPAEIMPRVLEAGKLYYGAWPSLPGESREDHFARITACLGGEKRGLILTYPAGEAVDDVLRAWHAAQT